MRRLVDVIADEAVLEIEPVPNTMYTVRMGRLNGPCDSYPLADTVWVIPLGEPDLPEDEPIVAQVEASLAKAGGKPWRAFLRHCDWTVPALAVTGLPEARVRWFADGLSPVVLRWSAGSLSVEALDEDEGVRSGSFQVTSADRRWLTPAVIPPASSRTADGDAGRVAEVAARRAGITPGRWGAYRPRPGVPLELVGRIPHPPAAQPRAAYLESGPWNSWQSTPGNVAFQAHAVDDIAWLVETLVASRLALGDAEERSFAAIRERLAGAGDPGWVSPSLTAVHQGPPEPFARREGAFGWPRWDRERQEPVPEAPLSPVEAAQARFLEHAPDDVAWLLERIGRLDAPGHAGRRVQTETSAVPDGGAVIGFPVDRSLGDLEVGVPGGGRPEPAGPARGFVTVPAGRSLVLRSGASFREDDLDLLAGLPRGTVNTLFLAEQAVSDSSLSVIGRLDGLRGLDLTHTQVTDDGLARLGDLDDLRLLNLTGTAVTDAGLRCLTGLGELRFLYLGDTAVTDAGLRCLTGLGELRILVLSSTRITDAGLAHLTGLTKLEELHLCGCTCIGDRGLRHLVGMEHLEVLDLTCTDVTEKGLEPRWALPRLRRLEATPGWM